MEKLNLMECHSTMHTIALCNRYMIYVRIIHSSYDIIILYTRNKTDHFWFSLQVERMNNDAWLNKTHSGDAISNSFPELWTYLSMSHSIHGRFTYISWLIFMVNVGKSTIHLWYGCGSDVQPIVHCSLLALLDQKPGSMSQPFRATLADSQGGHMNRQDESRQLSRQLGHVIFMRAWTDFLFPAIGKLSFSGYNFLKSKDF